MPKTALRVRTTMAMRVRTCLVAKLRRTLEVEARRPVLASASLSEAALMEGCFMDATVLIVNTARKQVCEEYELTR